MFPFPSCRLHRPKTNGANVLGVPRALAPFVFIVGSTSEAGENITTVPAEIEYTAQRLLAYQYQQY
jgi:hypothetical protein